jgi:hypothetical protein
VYNVKPSDVGYAITIFHGSYFHQPCTICRAIDHGEVFHKYIITKPCDCCGLDDHEICGPQANDDGTITTIWTCPILDTDIDIEEQLKEHYFKNRADPEKMAALHHYDMDTVLAALEKYKTYGIGRFRSKSHVKDFQNEVIRIVEMVRAGWKFKRTIPDENQEFQEVNTP